ncbi:serine hydrolase [Mycobacterium sp. URHB0044]|uniref:serine hydrolase domain-containing protein n=1 Tax=Mycobacterium sp. URHB0044 TaxID=1380386 RepID=UPI0018CC7628|nr:serine hydrolase [Mycobacterium sp. URHB0044]
MPKDIDVPASAPDAGAEMMSGFPPKAPLQVNVSNWQQPPHLRWSFRHMREIIPTQLISAGARQRLLTTGALEVGDTAVVLADGPSTVGKVFDATFTDAVLVIHDGTVVHEQYVDGMTARTPHLVMSISKSIVGCVAGVLVDRGQLDPSANVADCVPEVDDCGYHGATVRDVLDMRTGVMFRETYAASDSEVRAMERSMGWAPRLDGDPCGAYAYLTGIGTSGPHGGGFVYRSCDTDMLGWICERVAGRRMSDLISELLWKPLGAEYDADVTCDSVGTAVHDGGVSTTLRDLGRFGQMLLDDGMVDDRRVVPAQWLADAFAPPQDVRQVFARTDNALMLPGGWYRNQFWFFEAATGPVLLCLGIHGQLVYVDRASRTVVAKMSSWPQAQNPVYLAATLRACGALAAALDEP